MLIRKHDWEISLHHFVRKAQMVRFQYGVSDCCLIVADAIQAMTGIDIAASFRDQYKSRKAAMDLIKQHTGKATVLAIVEKVTMEHEMKEVPVLFARRGDMVLLKRSGDYSLGIVGLDGQHIIGIAKQGFLKRPLADAYKAYRV